MEMNHRERRENDVKSSGFRKVRGFIHIVSLCLGVLCGSEAIAYNWEVSGEGDRSQRRVAGHIKPP
jgi:hypothetical protein